MAPTILQVAGSPIPPEMAGLPLGRLHEPRTVICAESTNGQRGELMAHDGRFKLLYQRQATEGSNHMLFDLSDDPFELHNLYGAPAWADARQRLERALGDWFPAEGYETYLDEGAPTIVGPNVPPPGDTHREEILAYFRGAMRQAKQ
jgi:arylsulfatase A-like enzyme